VRLLLELWRAKCHGAWVIADLPNMLNQVIKPHVIGDKECERCEATPKASTVAWKGLYAGCRGACTAVIEATGGNYAVAQALLRHKTMDTTLRVYKKADHTTEFVGRNASISAITQVEEMKMPVMKRIAHLFLLLVLFSSVLAQNIEPWCANRELRMKEASSLHDTISAMDKQVPYLSPAEQRWLDGELSSGNGQFTPRVLKAMDSREHDISTAKSGFALLIIPLNNLRSLKLPCKDEVLLWTEVASRLPDNDLWQSINSLVNRKLISKQSASFLAANATLRSQVILNGVVIRYLRGELNCQ